MIALRVLAFARYAELLGAEAVQVEVPDRATVRDVVAALRELPGGDALPPTPILAVNLRQAGLADRVHPTDEVALLPPLAGG